MVSSSLFHLAYDAFGRMVLTLGSGEVHTSVVPVRGFPFSAPTQWISFCDEQGHEVYCLEDLAILPAEARELLESELRRREFVPVIRHIHSVSVGAEPTEWHVLTDRGETRFTLTSEDNIRRLGPRGALVTDSHGVRYHIPDTQALEAQSRRILRRYL